MKEVDDTPVTESESEDLTAGLWEALDGLNERLEALELRVANLEARKPPQDTNPDPEWYS
tara:strand:+ start:543 stop:722 length:180 start_codon:yes stop_codon:yes gene_type:complete